MVSRSFRCICAAVLACALQVCGAQAQELKRYRMEMSGFVVLAPEVPRATGVDRTVREGDVLISAPVGFAKAGSLRAPLAVTLGGLRFRIPEAALLLQATGTGGALSALPSGAPILCAPPESDRRKELPPLAKGERPRFDSVTQLCVTDSDGDSKVDKAFVTGTRLPTDRALIDISPTEFELARNVQIPGSSVQVVFFDGSILFGANVEIHVYLFGRKLEVETIMFGEGPKPARFNWALFPKKKLGFPQSIAIGPASFSLVSVNGPGKTAVVRHERDFTTTPLSWRLKPNYVYVYIAS